MIWLLFLNPSSVGYVMSGRKILKAMEYYEKGINKMYKEQLELLPDSYTYLYGFKV